MIKILRGAIFANKPCWKFLAANFSQKNRKNMTKVTNLNIIFRGLKISGSKLKKDNIFHVIFT